MKSIRPIAVVVAVLSAGFVVWPAAAIAQTGPIAAYSFDEGEGTTAHDASGNGHDATLEGTEWVGGKYGSALEFSGESCATVPGSAALELDGDFSLEAWVRPTEAEAYAPLIYREAPEESFAYALFLGFEKAGYPEGLVAEEPWSYSKVGASAAIPSNAWTHVALTNDGEHLRLYV
ncbi:MAG TPA: LamG-like jellyroll fold domain-containing protein, partial [Solirubrobacterales bacterium]|nr:LamG-like jellyroll fold domain-containing protein [Solirubrobacterales bacterium]